MTIGYITPTTNAPTYEENDAAQSQKRARALEEADALAAGYRVFGFVPKGNDWLRRLPEQAQGLPPALVARARAVLDAESSTLAAMRSAEQVAAAWVERNRPIDGQASADDKKVWTEARARWLDATAAVEPAMRALGTWVRKVEKHHEETNAALAKRRQLEMQLQLVERDIQTLQLQGAQLGI